MAQKSNEAPIDSFFSVQVCRVFRIYFL